MTNGEVYQPAKAEPRFFYGYIVVIVAFFIFMLSFGLQNSFGVFLKPLLTEFGWTRAVTSGAFSLSMALYGLMSIVMGGLNDRFGPRKVVTLCGFFFGLGYLLMSQVNAVWQLYLFYGVLTGIGISGVWNPLLSTVARWFVGRRSLMSGIALAGMSLGNLIAPPVISQLIAAYDWRLSAVILGGVVLVFMVLGAQFLRRDPSQMGQMPHGENEGKQPGLNSNVKAYSLKEAASTVQFWLLFIGLFCYGFSVFAIIIHIVPHAIELGISTDIAANILASAGGASIIGSLVLGSFGDRVGNRRVYIIGFILLSAALFWLMPASTAWMLFLSVAVFGFAQGGISAQGSPIVAKLFGLGSHGLIFGVVCLGFRIGAAVGPIVTGYIFDLRGSYQSAFLVSAVIGFAGIILMALLRPTKKLGGRI